jgi:anti-sigma regulatory factor (Ser/Thr protein kinase)
MPPAVRIPIDDSSQTGEARRLGLRMAADIGLDDTRAGQVGIVVTEACTNILQHAREGEILLGIQEPANGGPAQLEVLSLDRGPGMQDIERCIEDGFTTGSTPGHGLGAIRRLSDQSDFYSIPGSGTAILARWTGRPATPEASQRLQTGAVNTPKRGEEFCGDAWAIEETAGFFTLMVADGLGHGFEASQAAAEAVRMLRNHPDQTPGRLVDLVHHALRSLRGAAVAVARIDLDRGLVVFSGLGNVAAQIYTGAKRFQHLVSSNGTAGHTAGRIREFTYPWPANGLLMMHSDGLTTSTGLESEPSLIQRDPALIAGVLYRDFARGHDDATVVVARAA